MHATKRLYQTGVCSVCVRTENSLVEKDDGGFTSVVFTSMVLTMQIKWVLSSRFHYLRLFRDDESMMNQPNIH